MGDQQQQEQQQPPDDFPQFDVISDPTPIHNFTTKPTNTTRSSKKIMQEWKLLGKHLPETIYVRVYESRVDLLRAAIVGAPGTPYHDGLFFFDFYFPHDYPNRPPMGQYLSFGFRVNPNLYSDGSICLSLLNTWLGKKIEKWNPNTSNILQVLLSLQALVLNEKPFFNEPGYKFAGKSSWGEKKSLSYNQNVFILNCRSMLQLLRQPPANFEPLVEAHFKSRGEAILSASDAYRKGMAVVGNFDGNLTVQRGRSEVSKKFKQTMDIVHWNLVMALHKIGASSVDRYVVEVREDVAKKEALEKEKMEKKKKDQEKKKLKGGNGFNFLKKLKDTFSLGFWLKNKQSKTHHVAQTPLESQSYVPRP